MRRLKEGDTPADYQGAELDQFLEGFFLRLEGDLQRFGVGLVHDGRGFQADDAGLQRAGRGFWADVHNVRGQAGRKGGDLIGRFGGLLAGFLQAPK